MNAKSPRLGEVIIVLAATTAVQAMATLSLFTLSAIAPAVAKDLGVSASLIGYQISIGYVGAVIMSLQVGPLIHRWGACRTSQICLGLAATGSLLSTIPHIPVIALASVIIGFGYGLHNPSASHLLVRFAGQRHRNLFFSLKQTGVPLGGVLAGLIAPPVAIAVGWQGSPITVACMGLVLAVALQVVRARWDDDRDPTTRLIQNPFQGFGLVWHLKPLRWLSTAAFSYSVVQVCLMAFAVTLLVQEIGFNLAEAGLLLACMQSAGVVGRIFWGWVSDRVGDGLGVLFGVGFLMLALLAVTMAVAPDWPRPTLWTLFILLGFTAIGWNGVYITQIANLAPADRVGAATGGSLSITFTGVIFGPSLFSQIHGFIGSYTTTFIFLCAASVLGVISAFVARRAAALRAETQP